MSTGQAGRALLAVCAALALASGARVQTADAVAITGEAGLGGVARPGRWAPVVVTVTTTTTGVDGELVVDWGRSRVRRALRVPAPSTSRVALHIRTGDVRDALTAHVESGGRTLGSIVMPVEIVDHDSVVRLCLAADPAALGVPCSTTRTASALPAVVRTFDGADEAIAGDGSGLTSDHRSALQLWFAARRVETAGNAAPATGALPIADPRSRTAALPMGIYGTALAGALLWCGARRRPRHAHAALLSALTLGASAVVVGGRGDPITIRHTSMAEQFAGVDGALVTMRGVAQYPRRADGATAVVLDGAVDTAAANGVFEQRFDDHGAPILPGGAGAGSAPAFTLEGSAAFHVLEAAGAGAGVRVTNVSPYLLRGCAFPAVFARASASTLEPGAFVESTQPPTEADPIVACRLDDSPIAFRHPAHAVATRGTTIVVLHLPSSGSPE